MSHTQIMAPLKHDNLVKLYGVCWNEGADKLCIVLEYAANGSLHSAEKYVVGTWEEPRFEMALGVARCLEYLHHD